MKSLDVLIHWLDIVMSQSCLLQILFVCCFYYWIFCNFCPNFILVQYHHLFTKCLKKTNSRVSVSRLFPVVSCLPSSLILDTENSLYQIGFESINGSIHAKTSHWMVPGRCTIQYLLKPSRSFPDCKGRIVSSFWANIPNWYDTNNTTSFINIWFSYNYRKDRYSNP